MRSVDFHRRITAALAHHSPADPALIGVSGGRDSVALLHILHAQKFERLIVCHLDHGLRTESAQDAEFVRHLAATYGYPFETTHENIAAMAKQRRTSIETTARSARYAFFARIVREKSCSTLFLAHHADDQVETFLFNLFRGAAAAGLAGMRAQSTRTFDGTPIHIARPLLDFGRDELDFYVTEHRLAFREDPSNSDLQHTRNRIRHEVIPLLEREFGRQIRRSIFRAATILRDEDDFLARLASELPLTEELDAVAAREMPVALQRRAIFAWLKSRGIADVGFEDVQAVCGLLHGTGAKVNLPGGFHARRRAKKLFLERLPTSGLSD